MNEQPASFAHDAGDGCRLAVRVHPGALKNAVTGTHDGAIKISLTTPPTDGRANEALIALLAGLLRVPKARISLVSGATSRTKQMHITGKSAAEVHAALSPVIDC